MNKIIILIMGIFVLVGLVYALATFTAVGGGLVGHWALDAESYDSNTERITDKTPYENHGTNNGSILTTDRMGQSNRAMYFDGKTARDRISFGSFTIGTTGTYNLWIKGDKTAGVQRSENIYPLGIQMKHSLLGPSGGVTGRYGLITNDGTNRYYDWGNQDVYDNEWHMYTIAWNGTYVYAWLDGVSVGAPKAHSGQIFSGTGNFYAGAGWSSTYGTHTGELGEVRLYDQVLSDDEIDTLYHSYRPKALSGSLQKGLVGHWMLDSEDYNSATERITDKTPYENHGTNSGATLTTDQMGQSDRAMSFDGSGDYVSIPHSDSLNMSDNITISMWFKVAGWTTGYSRGLIKKATNTNDANFVLYYDGTWNSEGMMMYANRGGTWSTVSGFFHPIQLDTWYHMVWTYNNGGILYINGVQVGSKTGSGLLATNTQNLIIGTGFQDKHNGTISDVRIYNHALSAEEIDTLYHSYRPKLSSGSLQKGLVLDMPLKLKYTKDETVGSEIMTDRTPYSNDGQNYGATIGSDYTSFDGVDDYVTFNSITLSNESATLSWWMSPSQSSIDNGSYLFTNTVGDSYNSHILNNYGGKKIFMESDTNCNGPYWTTDYTEIGWHHWTVVFDNALAYLYIDGVLEGEADSYGNVNCTGGTATSVNNDMTLSVIGYKGTYVPLFNGSRDEVRIYERVLSPSEIKLLYDKGR